MAIATTALDGRFSTKIIQNTDVDENAVIDITGGTGKVFYVQVTSGSLSSTCYFKLYDQASIDLSTSQAPILILSIPASVTKEVIIPDGLPYNTALSFAMVTTPGDTGGSGPSATCSCFIVAS